MIQTTVQVSGMACSMCEAHINDAIRAAFPVEKVSSSQSKGETVILSQEPLDETPSAPPLTPPAMRRGRSAPQSAKRKAFSISGRSSIKCIPIPPSRPSV